MTESVRLLQLVLAARARACAQEGRGSWAGLVGLALGLLAVVALVLAWGIDLEAGGAFVTTIGATMVAVVLGALSVTRLRVCAAARSEARLEHYCVRRAMDALRQRASEPDCGLLEARVIELFTSRSADAHLHP